mmetsp:Transcript_15150/g.48325  ORF Transcript_15150/g.48325 Transcript_15150/m.48325 type:complete len:389 (+) Transcript_15150:1-1167(+)
MSSDSSELERHPQDLLDLPPKKANDVDFVSKLGGFIKSTYSSAARKQLDDALKALQQLRLDMLRVTEHSDASMKMLWKYYAQLNFVGERFPISREKLYIVFAWTNAFNPERRSAMPNVLLEKAGVLYTAARLESLAAAMSDRGSEEGVKSAAGHLQRAAGILDHIAQEVVGPIVGPTLTQDLHPASLGALSSIMLAQAQSCFYEKAAMASMSDSVLARLAAHAEALFAEALERMESFFHLKRTWAPFVAFHAALNRARAAYRQAKSMTETVEREHKGFGEQISWYRLAQSAAEDALRSLENGGKITAAWRGTVTGLQRSIAEAKEGVERDNNLIYMEEIPVETTTKTIDAAGLAKPLPLPEDATVDVDADLFRKLEEAVEDKSSCALM